MLVVETLAVDLGGDDVTDQIVAGLAFPLLDQRRQVLAHGARGGPTPLRVDRSAADALGPVVEGGVVLHGNPHDPRDHLDGVLARHVAHQIGPAQRGEAVDQLVDHRTHQLPLPALEGHATEGVGDEAPILGVLVPVHGEHERSHVGAHRHLVDARREGVGISQHGLHVVVAEDEEAVGTEGAPLLHRAGGPPTLPVRVGIAQHVVGRGTGRCVLHLRHVYITARAWRAAAR